MSETRPALYEPIKAGEYVEKRLAETYVRVEEGEGEREKKPLIG